VTVPTESAPPASPATTSAATARARPRWTLYYELTKPKVVALIVFTAIVGTLLASPGWPPFAALVWGNLGIALAAACAAGPLVWMAWNAHAHDGPLHFFRRVASYKRAIGEGATDTWSALALYPRLLVTTRPEIALGCALLALDVRRAARWGFVLLAALAQILFLAYGNARDGAPAHHPERALFAVFVMLACVVVAEPRRRVAHVAVAALAVVTWIRDRQPPGNGPAEDRAAAIAKGRALRGAEHLEVTPCAYEHFALVAAYGAPERVTIRTRAGGGDPSHDCPAVTVR